MRLFELVLPGTMLALALTADGAEARTKAPTGTEAYIIAPADGAKVKGPVTVVFGLKGMGIAPAGIDVANTGHHHLLIDASLPTGADLDLSIADDANHRHFGKGQTEVVLTLTPGRHTLQLLLGDKDHIPLDPVVASRTVTITVE
jgi:hypothetical protein